MPRSRFRCKEFLGQDFLFVRSVLCLLFAWPLLWLPFVRSFLCQPSFGHFCFCLSFVPKWSQIRPQKWSQNNPKMVQNDPKMAQHEPKMPQDGPKMAQDRPRPPQDAEKRPSLAMRLRRYGNCTVVRTPRGTPRWAKTFSGRARIAPASRRSAPGAARVPLQIRPKSAPRCPFWPRPGRQDLQRFSIPFWIDFLLDFPSQLGPLNGPKSIRHR